MRRLQTIAVLLVCAFQACSPPVTPAPKALTKNKLKNVYQAFRVLEAEDRGSIGEQLGRIPEQRNLHGKLLLLFSNNSQRLEIDSNVIAKGFLYDGYGNRFNVEFKTNLLLKVGATAITETDFDVVVWSSGANRRNEDGSGDDIYLRREPERAK